MMKTSDQAGWQISTGQLNSFTELTHPAYQPSRLLGALIPLWAGRPYLGESFPLRCFQRLSLPSIATQRMPLAGTTGTPEAQPSRSSRTMDSAPQVSFDHER